MYIHSNSWNCGFGHDSVRSVSNSEQGTPWFCMSGHFHASHAARVRISVVPVKLMFLIGTDTLKVFEARFDLKKHLRNPGAGDFQGTVLRGSRAGHLTGPVLPNLSVHAIRDSRTIVFRRM